MNTQKLTLDELSVQSFITSFNTSQDATINGGFIPVSHIDGCRSALIECDIVFPRPTVIRTFDTCRSMLDACPSALSCPFDELVTPFQKLF